MKIRPVIWIVLPVFLTVALLMIVYGRTLRRFVGAGFLLADIVDGTAGRTDVRRQPIIFQSRGRVGRADLYRSSAPPRAGLLLLPGVAEQGGDDPRLVTFATALARARFAVLVPELAGLRRLRVSSGDVREVADAFAWLAGQADLAPSGRAGMAAFSYAAGPAILAAMDADISDRVGFVFAVGGYYDLRRVLAFFTTGYFDHDGRRYYLPPDDYGKWAFIAGNVDRLRDVADRRLMQVLAYRLKHDPGAPTSDIVSQLGSEGRSLWAFVSNRDPARVPVLLRDLPVAIRDELTALNPAEQDLSKLHAPLILVHGYEDPMIPFPESIALSGAATATHHRLYLVHGLVHVDVAPGLPDRWRLVRALQDLLAARDGAAPF